jgi:5-methyltetrahydropteroyltriglutamate--homocysteine methyltransferase
VSHAPIRAEVVGSLLRPPFLLRARAQIRDGLISPSEYKSVEDRAIDTAIALQEGTGIDVVTDGEFRRGIFTGPLDENVTGLEFVPGVTRTWYTDTGPVEEELPLVVTGKLAMTRSVLVEEYTYARARARRPVKVTVPSPLMMLQRWSPTHAPAQYPDAFAMAADAAEIIRTEINELVRLGCTHVQIDAPEIATLVQQETRDWFERQGVSIERMLTEGLELINSLTGIAGVTYGIHLCRGNRNGRWMAAGGYDFVAEALFRRASGFDRFLLEYDDERSGSFAPLRAAGPEKIVVLGLVSTKSAHVESPQEVAQRIHEAADYIPLEQLAVSTQCGFASTVDAHPDLTEQVQADKLRVVSEVATVVWDGC